MVKDFYRFYYKLIKFNSVESITTKDMTKPRPQALNTVELMRSASSGLGLGPHSAMQIAEKYVYNSFCTIIKMFVLNLNFIL